jgi:hypothetical protein
MTENICPICNVVNNCMGHAEKTCWCLEVKVPQELLALVANDKKRRACICLKCINEFNDNPKEFLNKHIK